MRKAWERLAQGRSSLLLSHPFFAIPSMKYPSVLTESEPTAATDGRKFFFNPVYILGLVMDELKTLIAHEVLHILLKHHLRRGNRNLKLWNLVCDYIVNAILVKAGFKLPPGALYDPQYDGMTPEQLYAKLYRPPPPETQPETSDETSEETESSEDEADDQDAGDSEEDGGQDESGDEGEPSESEEESDQAEEQPGEESGEEVEEDSAGQAGGDDQEEEESEEQAGKGKGQDEGEPADLSQFEGVPDFGSVRDYADEDGEPASEEEIAQAESEVEVLAVQAAQYAETQAGSIPGELKRAIEEAMHPELPWWRLLERFMVMSSSHGYNWARPNKRFISTGIHMPARQSRDLDEVVILVDTSYSINDKILNLFGFHINAIMGMHPATVHVVYFDSRVASVQTFEASDQVELEPKGGGGTDYVPPFGWIRENDVYPTCIIVLTDGYCDSFPEDPEIPVLWVLNEANTYFSPPFGETIEMEEK